MVVFQKFIRTITFALCFHFAQSHGLGLYRSEARMEVEWATQNDVNLLSFRSIYQLENVTARYVQGLLDQAEHASDYMYGRNAIQTDVDAMDLQLTDDIFTMVSQVQVTYVAEEPIPDLASILILITRKDTANGLMIRMFEVLGSGATSMTVNFKTDQSATKLLDIEHSHGRNAADQGLILACTLLCAALVIVSGVLLYIVGGWRDLRDQIEEQLDMWKEHNGPTMSGSNDSNDQRPTSYDQDDNPNDMGGALPTIPSAESGMANSDTGGVPVGAMVSNALVNPSEGLGVTNTPERGIYEEDNAITPYSDATSFTDTSRAPLGITSIRKMQYPNHPNSTAKMMEMSNFRMGMQYANNN